MPNNVLIFSFVTLASTSYLILQWKKYIIDYRTIFLLTMLMVVYLFYRNNDNSPWIFTDFKYFKGFKYFDAIILYPLLASYILLIKRLFRIRNGKSSSEFLADNPRFEAKDDIDEFGYKDYAKTLSNKIKNSHSQNSFAIGINGSWGSGKSSFVNLIKLEFVDTDVINVDFNPWNSLSSAGIIKDFFATFESTIYEYHKPLGNLISKYSNKLTEIDSNPYINSLKLVSDNLYRNDYSANRYFDEINSNIKIINKKIIIYIDDLDRLDKDEVFEVIKLIRNTANFYNTFFICAYDRNYIIKSINNKLEQQANNYLEKIFQLEINLPRYNENKLDAIFINELKKLFEDNHNSKIDTALFNHSFLKGVFNITEWIFNYRDIVRVINSIDLNFKELIKNGDVDILECIQVEIIRVKYPLIYEDISQGNWITKKTTRKDEDYYILKLDKSNNNLYKEHLNRNKEGYLLDEDEINSIIKLLDIIFINNRLGAKPSLISVANPNAFDRYFSYHLGNNIISNAEFDSTYKSDEINFLESIVVWTESGKSFDLINKLLAIDEFETKEIFEKYILGVFRFCQIESIKKESFLFPYAIYNKLFHELNNTNIGVKLYSNKIDFKNYTHNLLNNAPAPFIFEADFIAECTYKEEKYNDNFIISYEERITILSNYLIKYLSNTSILDENIWHIYRSSYTSYKNLKHKRNEVKKIIFDFALKNDFDNYLLALITKDNKNNFYQISGDGIYFSTYESLGIFLTNQSDIQSKYLSEFKEFYKECSKFDNPIKFDFKKIPLN